MIKKILRYLKTKNSSDYGSDVLVVGVVFAPIMIIAVGFALDMTKNTYLMNAYEDMAQAAVRAASNERNIQGELTRRSAETFVREYRRQRGDDESHLRRTGVQTVETGAFRPAACETMNASEIEGIPNNRGNVRFPYIKFDYTQTRGGNFGANSFYSIGGSNPQNMNSYNARGNYVMVVQVYDVGSNFLLGMIGQRCQVYSSQVSSTVVLEDRDWYQR